MTLLAWSGGCDSTLLLNDLLGAKPRAEDGVRVGRYAWLPKDDIVRTIALEHYQVNANAQNRRARDRLMDILIERHQANWNQKVWWRHSDVKIKHRGGVGVEPGNGIIQSPLWIGYAALCLNQNEDLVLGLIDGDCSLQYQAELQTAFTALQRAMGKSGKLYFPLNSLTKGDVIVRLKAAGLYQHTWYCERPRKDGRRCGDCSPCRTHRTALWQIKTFKRAYRLPV